METILKCNAINQLGHKAFPVGTSITFLIMSTEPGHLSTRMSGENEVGKEGSQGLQMPNENNDL